jgi:putative drug exporter of the RND superfamily
MLQRPSTAIAHLIKEGAAMQQQHPSIDQQLAEERSPGTSSEESLALHPSFSVGLAYGRFIYRFRWFFLAFWIVALVASVPYAMQLPSLLSSGGFQVSGSESAQVSHELIEKLHIPPSTLTVVFHSATTNVNDPAYQQELNSTIDTIRAFHDVTSVTPGGVGQDGRTTFVNVGFDKDEDSMRKYIADFRARLPGGANAHPAQVYLTGRLAVEDDLNTISLQDVERADTTVLPIAGLLLLAVFGTFGAAILPLVLAIITIPLALAVIYPIASASPITTSVTSIVSIIGLGLSIDYSLFITRRFREELAGGRDTLEALAWTVATAGEAIVFSGLTVMIGFCGLMLIGTGLTSVGLGGAATVAVAVLAALTFLPALLSILGSRINALRVPWLWRLTMPKAGAHGNNETGFWHRLAMGVMRLPVMIIALVVLMLVGLGWPAFSLTIGSPISADTLPRAAQSRQGLAILTAQYPSFNENPLEVTAQTPDGSPMLLPENLQRLAALSHWLAHQPHVTGAISLTNPPATPDGPTLDQQTLLSLYATGGYTSIPALAQFVSATTNGGFTHLVVNTNTQLESDAGRALVDHLRAGDTAAGQGLHVQVGGAQALVLDFDRFLYSNFPKAILFILGATFLVLLLLFRSLLLPLKALLMNVLSVSAAYGVLVFIFQWGNFSNLLSFTSSGFIDSLVPIVLFCILFGLSMDYEVFLLSRIREEWLRTPNNRQAVAHGLEKTGSVITNAALLFMVVTVSFTFTSVIDTKEVGVGMTVAVLVDATIIRSLLVPATMRLLGRWNWWLPGLPVPKES